MIRRLSSALYGTGHEGTGLETADVNDQETLDRLRDDAKRQARDHIEAHLRKFLDKKKKGSPPRRRNSYEAWIAQLHPENATVTHGVVTDVDPRFFSEGSDHRVIWNRRQPQKRVDAIVDLDYKYALLGRSAMLVQRRWRGVHARSKLRSSLLMRRRAAQDACLQAWKVAFAPLEHRGAAWDRLFGDVWDRRGGQLGSRRLRLGPVTSAETEAAAWRRVDATPERRARVKAESKRMYRFLQRLDKRDVGTIAAAFGFRPRSRRRKRKVVAALFDSARTAPPSAALLRRAAAPVHPPGLRGRNTVIVASGPGDTVDPLAPPPPSQASVSELPSLYPRKLCDGRRKKLWESTAL